MHSRKPGANPNAASRIVLAIIYVCALALASAGLVDARAADSTLSAVPAPLLEKGHPVDWWFVFKFNTHAFPGCDDDNVRECAYGGEVRRYAFGQQFVYASSEDGQLQKGRGCLGDTKSDPVGATFDEIYNGSFYYVIWNDQFYNDPPIAGCGKSCASPWGHSKGMLVWDGAGDGFVMQVTTPSWPGAGSSRFPRMTDGNTLGCVKDDDVKVSQHFLAMKLNESDVVKLLEALRNASIVTDPQNPQIVRNGGPPDVQALVKQLGTKSHSTAVFQTTLSNGIKVISKPSHLHVPPWQLVSAELGGVALRTATWWAKPRISSTTAATRITCWSPDLPQPGAVEIATSGVWESQTFGLKGGPGIDFNHAKIGVSISGTNHYAIFGDLNQQGTLSGRYCDRSQNGRGGLFYIIRDKKLSGSLARLISGDTAPVAGARPSARLR